MNRILVLTVFFISACHDRSYENGLFEKVSGEYSGVQFVNEIKNTPEFNILNYMYFNNGGGVSVQDFNNDGLLDIFFTANQKKNRLYLNKGNFQFEDVTEVSNISGPSESWTTGTTTVDINDDGWMDIYVSMLGKHLGVFGSNKLYVNKGLNKNGIPLFEEESSAYGLDLVGFSTQAAFFDYDLDGDLDMFQLNHSLHTKGTFVEKSMAKEKSELAGDKLLRNTNGIFQDVTEESGIRNNQLGYGLGLGVSDINDDGYPDIYVGNDFHEDDYLYINNGDGTFRESLNDQMNLTSRYSMGNDIADLNNDGYSDVVSVDMLPDDYEVLKASQTEDSYQIFMMKKNLGYGYQYSRNTLQLNNGDNSFSEIGLYAGISATDWSWSPLIADFNLDGNQELFVTNGIVKRPNDLDYLNFTVSNNERMLRAKTGSTRLEELDIIDLMPELKINNYLFKNSGSMKFEDVAQSWGINEPSYSSGSVYADLDNDGDLDLIVNNTNQESFLYRNLTSEKHQNAQFIAFRMNYLSGNSHGVGSKIFIELENGQVLSREAFWTRGFQSSVSSILNFGIPSGVSIKKLVIRWPNRKVQVLKNYELNTLNNISYHSDDLQDSVEINERKFESVTALKGLNYKHEENVSFFELLREPLILQSQATEGPAIAVGDVNNDGLEDIYLGGAKLQKSALFFQRKNGFEYQSLDVFELDKLQEEISATWVDVDNDNDQDLAVLVGGNEFSKGEEAISHKLYINDEGEVGQKRKSIRWTKVQWWCHVLS